MSEQPKSFDYWDYFAGECERANAPLYAQIIRGVMGDPDLKEFASHVKKGQPQANMLLASVHLLLLRGAQDDLRRFYPNLNGGRRIEGEDPFPHFKDFVEAHRAELAPLIVTGVTNTNEVARCSTLHAGFRAVARQAGKPLNLIEIGPSAGLNLIWDKYRVRYRHDGKTFEVGAPEPALTIDCELRGGAMPPLGPTPKVASRVGLELNPVDLGNPDSRDWLRALVWPDQVERFQRLEKVIEIFRREKVEIRSGDALALLSDTIARIPESEAVCVYHTYVTYQFSDAMRETLNDILTVAGLRRPLWRLSAEGSLASVGEAPLLLGHYHDGVHETRELALCHPHGAWLEWRA